MRIAVNLLPFRAQLAGAGRYAQNILRELVALDANNAYTFFVAARAAAHFAFDAPNVQHKIVNLPNLLPARLVYEQCVLPLHQQFDILFTPSVAIPLAWRGKKVTVIHDMMAEQRALEKYPPLRNAYVRWMSRYAARHSDVILTVSENSRRDISAYARVPLEKILLAPNAAAPNFTPIQDETARARVRDAYHLPEHFILYLGTLEPGKNLPFLVRAYARMKHAHPELEQHLVLAGAPGWGVSAIENEIARSDASGFHIIGFVEEDDLAALYSLADLFVYPSLYEGFGVPPLEAMACGTPVIVSNVSALPEVLGAAWTGQMAGLMASPRDQDAWAAAMARVLSDRALRDKLQRLGLERAREFSWQASAQVVLDAFNALL